MCSFVSPRKLSRFFRFIASVDVRHFRASWIISLCRRRFMFHPLTYFSSCGAETKFKEALLLRAPHSTFEAKNGPLKYFACTACDILAYVSVRCSSRGRMPCEKEEEEAAAAHKRREREHAVETAKLESSVVVASLASVGGPRNMHLIFPPAPTIYSSA